VIERPRSLRPPPRSERGRRLARWIAARNSPAGRALQAIGVADQRLLVALRTRGHNLVLDRFFGALGGFGEVGSGWAAIGALGAATDERRRARWLVAASAAPAGMLANYAVKLTVGRQRPLIDDHPPLARAPSKLSFPSGHATSGFAGAVALGRVAPELRPALLGLAAVICLGRPYLGMHYPSDVVAGALLGTAVGALYPLPSERTADSRQQRAIQVDVQGEVPS
jgi:undecaprenyl-diphosphatase